jgi:hypothetical protein
MSAGTLYDTGAQPVEVRIYDHGRLLTRELCESEDDAAAVVERWSDVANLFVVADDISAQHEPDDILAPEDPLMGGDEDQPLASMPLPGYGTE